MKASSKPFEFIGNDLGVLCIHGFSSTPFELRYVGEELHAQGFSVSGPTLPGHGTQIRDLDSTTWQQWEESVKEAFFKLRRQCKQVCVLGQSLGGLLALNLARDVGDEISGLAALATPLWLSPISTKLIQVFDKHPWLHRVVPAIPKFKGSDIRSQAAKEANPTYPAMSTRGVMQLHHFMQHVRSNLGEVTQPLLIMHGDSDHTAPPECAPYLEEKVSSTLVRRVRLPLSYHLIAIDVEKEKVAAEVGAFFTQAFAKKLELPL